MAINPNRWANLADDAQMIQAAVDEAAKTGQTVVIPARNERTGEQKWVLERAVRDHGMRVDAGGMKAASQQLALSLEGILDQTDLHIVLARDAQQHIALAPIRPRHGEHTAAVRQADVFVC